MDLEKKQADMRRRMARRRKAEQAAKCRARKLSPIRVPQETREFHILYSLYCYANHTASYDNLRHSSANGYFGGRGWWIRTFWGLEEDGKLEWITIRGRDFVRLTKSGQSFVMSQLAQQHTQHQPT